MVKLDRNRVCIKIGNEYFLQFEKKFLKIFDDNILIKCEKCAVIRILPPIGDGDPICYKYCCKCCPDHECDDPLEIDFAGEFIANRNEWFSDEEDVGLRITKKTRKKMKETKR